MTFRIKPLVAVVGALPPPLNGAASATVMLCDILVRHGCRVLRCSTAPLARTRGIWWTLSRCLRVAAALLRLFRADPGRCLVLQGAGGAGNLYNAILALAGRALGYSIAYCHHSFAYIDRRDWIFALLVRCAGPNALHVVLCRCMGAHLAAAYGVKRSTVMSGWVFVPPAPQPPALRQSPFVLGHLGNLSREKGLDLVLDTFRHLRRSGTDVRLVLAGLADDYSRQAIAEAQAEMGLHMEYLGPVSDAGKEEMLERLDAFLLPSRYRNEAQPRVLLEAMAHGAPVIALARGCIPDDVDPERGLVVNKPEDFVEQAAQHIQRWIAAPDAFALQRRKIWERSAVDHQTGLQQSDEFVRQLTCGLV